MEKLSDDSNRDSTAEKQMRSATEEQFLRSAGIKPDASNSSQAVFSRTTIKDAPPDKVELRLVEH